MKCVFYQAVSSFWQLKEVWLVVNRILHMKKSYIKDDLIELNELFHTTAKSLLNCTDLPREEFRYTIENFRE